MTKHWFGLKNRGGPKIVDGKLVSGNENPPETVDNQGIEENYPSQPHEMSTPLAQEMGQAQVEQSLTSSREESPACGQGPIFCANGGQEKASGEVLPRDPEEAARWWDEVADWLRGPEEAQEALAEEPKCGRPPGWRRFKNYLEAAKKAPRTIKEYRYEFNWWEAEAKRQKRSIYRLKARHIERAVAKLQPATAKRKMAFLKVYAKFLLREGWPALFEELEKCVRPKTPESLPRDLGPEKFLELRERARALVAEGDRRGIWLGLMLLCGLRISEIATCRPQGKNQIKVTGKGGKERLVPCPGWLVKALKSYRRDGRGGWAKHRAIIWSSLARLGVRNPHSLRHTYASELLRRGRTLEEIQYLLGHANIATTNIYARLRTPPDVLASLGE